MKQVALCLFLCASVAVAQHDRHRKIDTLDNVSIRTTSVVDTTNKTFMLSTPGGWDIGPSLVLPDSTAVSAFFGPWTAVQGSLYRSGTHLYFNQGSGSRIDLTTSGSSGGSVSLYNLGGTGIYKNTSSGIANLYGLLGSSNITLTQNATTIGLDVSSNVAKTSFANTFTTGQSFMGAVNSVSALQSDGQTNSSAIFGNAFVGIGVNGQTLTGIGVQGMSVGSGIGGYFASVSGTGVLIDGGASATPLVVRQNGATVLSTNSAGNTSISTLTLNSVYTAHPFAIPYTNTDGLLSWLSFGTSGTYLKSNGTSLSWAAGSGGSGGPVDHTKDSSYFWGADSAFHSTVKVSTSPGNGLIDSAGHVVSRSFQSIVRFDSLNWSPTGQYDVMFTTSNITIDSVYVTMLGNSSNAPYVLFNIRYASDRSLSGTALFTGVLATVPISTTGPVLAYAPDSPNIPSRQCVWVSALTNQGGSPMPRYMTVYINWRYR